MPSVAIIGSRGYPSFYGGFETAVRYIAPAFVNSGWEVTVYSRPGETVPEWEFRDSRINVVETKGVNSRSLSTLTYGLSSALHAARNRPDVALVMNVANGLFLPTLSIRRVPTIVNVDGLEWLRAKWGRLARIVFRLGAYLSTRLATELIVDSIEIGRVWQRKFGRAGHFIPYGGSVPQRVIPLPGPLKRGKYVLMVARLVPENSVTPFLEAARVLSDETDVVIVGSSGFGDPIEQEIKRFADNCTSFHWLGHVKDDQLLHALWQNCGVYFHGHTVGGTNPALVQAMACGAPTVAVDTPFNREVLGEQALFTAVNSETILSSIRSALADDLFQEASRSANTKRATELYSWESISDSYIQLATKVAASRSRMGKI